MSGGRGSLGWSNPEQGVGVGGVRGARSTEHFQWLGGMVTAVGLQGEGELLAGAAAVSWAPCTVLGKAVSSPSLAGAQHPRGYLGRRLPGASVAAAAAADRVCELGRALLRGQGMRARGRLHPGCGGPRCISLLFSAFPSFSPPPWFLVAWPPSSGGSH